jgi:hypothetical protein
LDKKIAGLLGAVAALGTIVSSDATPLSPAGEVLQANSYADLLTPIPNAGALLRAMDEQQGAGDTARVQLAQYHHHHHHHHHHHYRHRHHHHHHHHHHN